MAASPKKSSSGGNSLIGLTLEIAVPLCAAEVVPFCFLSKVVPALSSAKTSAIEYEPNESFSKNKISGRSPKRNAPKLPGLSRLCLTDVTATVPLDVTCCRPWHRPLSEQPFKSDEYHYKHLTANACNHTSLLASLVNTLAQVSSSKVRREIDLQGVSHLRIEYGRHQGCFDYLLRPDPQGAHT